MKKYRILIFCLIFPLFGQKPNKGLIDLTSNSLSKSKTESESSIVPKRLSYQGLLTQSNGQPVSDGDYLIKFSLFNSLTGNLPFWEESQTVSIDDGLINTVLGIINPIEAIDSQAYLEINIDGTTLSPRQEMTSVFYSMISDTSKYAKGGDYLNLENRPDLSNYIQIDTLSSFVLRDNLDSIAFTGDYNDLNNLPDLSNVFNADTLSSYATNDALLSLVSSLSPVSLSNNYTDLENLPDLSIFLTGDTLSDYVLQDSLSAVAISNDYDDLSNLPDLTNYTTETDLNNALSNFTPSSDLSSVATSGDYNDLQNLPDIAFEIGQDVQAYDEDLDDLADGTLTSSKVQYLENVTSDVQTQLDAKGTGTVSSLSDLSVTATADELNYVDGVTSNIQTQLDAKGTGTVSSLSDGVTATADELNYVDGVTSNIQTQLDAKGTGTVSSLSDLRCNSTAAEAQLCRWCDIEHTDSIGC